MPLTREQREDFKALFKESIDELMQNSAFIEKLSDHIFIRFDKKLDADLKTIIQKNELLGKDNEILRTRVHDLEQYSRKNNIRIFGIPVALEENLEDNMCKLINEKLKVDIRPEHIDNCHRIGKNVDGKQPIIIKLTKYKHKEDILKNASITRREKIYFSEDLTQERFNLLRTCKKSFGNTNVWSRNGVVNVRCQSKKFKIKTLQELEELKSASRN
ncbi:l1 transposable element-related [Holotrichia oblita]|uniref:L1 transposable element-related n=1 Tax=Holotrichia oblita TaxID=644536 RepID=A0ACB9T3N9_HOLOL|nr:l1 transposable element-related [Holotrichia oblita]